jgi:L-lactate dehydrogenase complex protein LldF
MRSPLLERARQAIADSTLQRLLDKNARTRRAARQAALRRLEDSESLRQRAHEIRRSAITDLEKNLRNFSQRLSENGVVVHHATDAGRAIQIVLEIAAKHGASRIVKSKSMLTEEIELNAALKRAGVQAVETDLGEYIVQLRGEPPSHILTPALHLTREQVAESMRSALGTELSDDVEEINHAARRALREEFLSASIGVTGVNFGVVKTGTLCLVTNEGNGRMVNTLPPVHIAIMGIERLVPTLEDLSVMLKLLPRAATGQQMTSYVSLVHRPRKPAEPDGPQERHVILVDNGRSRLATGSLSSSLDCIRCGACLSACPVFQEIGGHAYGSVYPGPIGSVLSPGLFGVERFGHLAKASTLCGACLEVCPVGVDIPSMLLQVRSHVRPPDARLKRGLQLYAWAAQSPGRFRWAQRFARVAAQLLPTRARWISQLPGPLAHWTRFRDFPPFAAKPLRSRPGRRSVAQARRAPEIEPAVETEPMPLVEPPEDKVDRFEAELVAIGGEVIRCSAEEVPDRLIGQLYILGGNEVLSWGPLEPILYSTGQRLEEDGFKLIQPEVPIGPEQTARLQELDRVSAGITGAVAGLADTGTLVLATGSRRSLLPSLLPDTHLAILRAKDIYEDMDRWLLGGGAGYIANSSNLVLISGPSRTADIEMTLTIGVHGPRQVIVFLVE